MRKTVMFLLGLAFLAMNVCPVYAQQACELTDNMVPINLTIGRQIPLSYDNAVSNILDSLAGTWYNTDNNTDTIQIYTGGDGRARFISSFTRKGMDEGIVNGVVGLAGGPKNGLGWFRIMTKPGYGYRGSSVNPIKVEWILGGAIDKIVVGKENPYQHTYVRR